MWTLPAHEGDDLFFLKRGKSILSILTKGSWRASLLVPVAVQAADLLGTEFLVLTDLTCPSTLSPAQPGPQLMPDANWITNDAARLNSAVCRGELRNACVLVS